MKRLVFWLTTLLALGSWGFMLSVLALLAFDKTLFSSHSTVAVWISILLLLGHVLLLVAALRGFLRTRRDMREGRQVHLIGASV